MDEPAKFNVAMAELVRPVLSSGAAPAEVAGLQAVRLRSSAMRRETFVHEAELRLNEGADDHKPGAAVTVALCGHWEHEGPCRWPHNNALAAEPMPAASAPSSSQMRLTNPKSARESLRRLQAPQAGRSSRIAPVR